MRTSIRVVSLAVVTIANTSLASAQKKGCDPVPDAIVATVGAPVYRECDVSKKAEPPRPGRMSYEPSRVDRSCIRAEVEIVVDASGVPVIGTARVLRADDPELGRAMVEELPMMRYKPAVKDGQPVAVLTKYTRVVTIVIRGAPRAAPKC